MSDRNPDRLNAYLDGELHGKDRAAVEAWLAEDEGARLELEALRATRQAVAAATPDTPDIDEEWRQLSGKLDAPAATGEAGGGAILPFPLPAGLGAAAALLLVGLIAWTALRPDASPPEEFSAEIVEFVETDLEDSSTIVYIDPGSGWTVVWVEETGPLEGPIG